jgi:uncharacterized protein YcbK (DUF882 family)
MLNRRLALAGGAGVLCASLAPRGAWAASPIRRASFLNLHTGDVASLVYAEHGSPIPDALHQIDRVLRDHRTGEVHTISVSLLDLLDDLRARMDFAAPFHVISGYRSPATNAMLHAASSGVASRSLHMRGMAIDVRVPGVELARLRGAALALARGGVGYYPGPDFVHIDTGRVRSW